MMNKQRRSGFTLIELMIVIALVGVIAGLAGPYFVDYLQRLRGIAGELATDLAYARSEAVSRRNYVQLRVQNTSTMSCYIIAVRTTPEDSGYMCDCTAPPANRCIEPGTTELKTVQVPVSMLVNFAVALPPGQSVAKPALTINPRSGGVYFPKASEDWRQEMFIIDTQLDNSRRIRSQMEALGKVTICVPSGSAVTGLPAC
jgi:prepilin-type N-terminal cleavage/methylation domain-containing protein